MQKIVSQLDRDGYFVALTVADESPLEPGVFLLPAGAIDEPPPDVPEGKFARWVSPGWMIVDTIVSEPPPPVTPVVPAQITRAQARAVLIIRGLIDQVQPAIDAIEDPLQRALAQNDWDNRLHFERTNPTLLGFAQALDLTDDDLDAMFILGATL